LTSMNKAMPYSIALSGAFSTSRLLSQLLVAGLVTLAVPRCLADRATYDPTKTMVAFPVPTPPVVRGGEIFETTPIVIDGDITDEEWLPSGGSWSVTVNPLIADGIHGGELVSGHLPAN